MIVTFLPARRRAISSHQINKVPWCIASDIMLRRSYAKNAYLNSLVLHKDQAIRAADQGAKTLPIWPQKPSLHPPPRPCPPAARAPPKRPFQRGRPPRL